MNRGICRKDPRAPMTTRFMHVPPRAPILLVVNIGDFSSFSDSDESKAYRRSNIIKCKVKNIMIHIPNIRGENIYLFL
jgi:hypothetical protein